MDMEQFFHLPTLKYGDYTVKNKVLYCTTYFEFVTETWSSSVLHITLILARNDRITNIHYHTWLQTSHSKGLDEDLMLHFYQ